MIQHSNGTVTESSQLLYRFYAKRAKLGKDNKACCRNFQGKEETLVVKCYLLRDFPLFAYI